MDKIKTHIKNLYYAQGDIFDYKGGGFDAIIVFIEGGFSGINTEYWTREKELADAPVMVIPFNGSSPQKVRITLNNIHRLVFMTLDTAAQHGKRNIGFHGIRAEDADDHTGAEYTIKAVSEWLSMNPGAVESVTLVDIRNCYKEHFAKNIQNMNYIDYIISNKEKAKTLECEVKYEDIFKKSLMDVTIPGFQDVLNEFAEKKSMTRNDIFKEVENGNLYKAFLMIILWGNLNQKNINRVATCKNIEERLKNTYNLLNGTNEKKRNVELAFSMMEDAGEEANKTNNHINGIGVSFFTKILYFFDKSKKCLIFDLWGRREHCALIESGEGNVSDYYILKVKSRSIIPEKKRKVKFFEIYMDYVKRINVVANKIGIVPEKLEEYLFGYVIGSKQDKECQENDIRNQLKSPSNPRRFLVDYLNAIQSNTIDNEGECQSEKSTSSKKIRKKWGQNDILEGEWLPLNNTSIFLFVGRMPNTKIKKQKYFCELNFMKKIDKNINIVAKPIFDKFGLPMYSWISDNHQYKFVEFGNDAKGLVEAKALMKAISDYVKTCQTN